MNIFAEPCVSAIILFVGAQFAITYYELFL